MKFVVLHYPFIAKYRIPIFTLLNKSKKYKYEFWADEKSSDKYLITETEGLSLKKIKMKEMKIPLFHKSFEWQPGAIKSILYENMDAYIVLGNPNSLSTWICVFIAKLKKVPVFMWSHGYIKDEKGLKAVIRKLFYSLANRHLLYGNRAKNIMMKKGFDENILHVVYNSLDYSTQSFLRESLNYEDRVNIRKKLSFNENSIVLIAIGRLMKKLKLKLLINAIKMAQIKNLDINLIIVGDGEEKKDLVKEVAELKIEKRIYFYGACHDEKILATLYNAVDYSIVMGKVGLAAMHSLAYGIPMITHNNLNSHFPEVESIVDGKTGFLFEEDNLLDFISKIKPIEYRGYFYNACITMIEMFYTPEKQQIYIEQALSLELQK